MKEGFDFVFGEKTDFDFRRLPVLKLEVLRTTGTLELATFVSPGWPRWIRRMTLTTKTAVLDDIMDLSSNGPHWLEFEVDECEIGVGG